MTRDEKIKRFGKIINKVWNYIGDDMFFNDLGERDYSMTFTRGTVVEVCIDADRAKTFGCTCKEDEEVVDWYCGLKYGDSTRKEIIRKAIPNKTFGN